MNWEMMVFRESPLGQDMMKEEAQRMLLRLLQYRFGEVPESVQATLQGLKTDELEELGEALFRVNSLEEFTSSLPVAAANGSAT